MVWLRHKPTKTRRIVHIDLSSSSQGLVQESCSQRKKRPVASCTKVNNAMFATCFLDVFHCFSSLNMLKQTRSEGLPLGSPRLGRLANAVKAACVMTGSGSTWKVSTCPSMVQSLKNLPDFFRQLQGTSNFTFCFYLLVLAAGCFHLFPSASGTVVLTLARLLSFRRMACKQRVTTRRVPTEPCRAMQGKPGFIARLTNAI